MASQAHEWSISSCDFCTRDDVRTLNISHGRFMRKLYTALKVNVTYLEHAKSICTLCLADIDLIIRSERIKEAMGNYFINMTEYKKRQSLERQYRSHIEEPQTVNTQRQTVINKRSSFNLHPVCTSTEISEFISNSQALSQVGIHEERQEDSRCEVEPSTVDIDHKPNTQTMNSPKHAEPDRFPANTYKKRREGHLMYQCLLCPKICGSKSHIKEHIISHSSLRPFTCLVCQKTYKAHKACREHLMGTHQFRDKVAEVVDHIGVDPITRQQLEELCMSFREVFSSVAGQVDVKSGVVPITESDSDLSSGTAKVSPDSNANVPPQSSNFPVFPTVANTSALSYLGVGPNSDSIDYRKRASPPSLYRNMCSPCDKKKSRKSTPHRVCVVNSEESCQELESWSTSRQC